MNADAKDPLLPRHRGAAWLLIVLVAFGCLVRFLPIGYGSPEAGAFSADEIDSVSRALVMAEGDLMPIHASKPTLYPGKVAAGLGMRYVWLRVTQGTTVDQYADLFFLEPFPFYLIARLISVLSSCAILVALWIFTRGMPTALRAILLALMVLMPSSIYYGHLAKEDAFASALTFIAFGFAWIAVKRLHEEQNAKPTFLLLSAFAAGLAISTKYNCFFAPLFCGLAWLVFPDWRRRFWIAPALIGTTLLGFVLGTPYALLNPGGFLSQTLGSDIALQVAGDQKHINYLDKSGPLFMLRIFWEEWKLALLPALLFAALLARRQFLGSLPFTLPIALYFLVLLISGQLDYQYVLPITAPLLLLAGGGFHLCANNLNQCTMKPVTTLSLACVGVALLLNLHLVANRTVAYLSPDPRQEAAAFLGSWLAENPEHAEQPILFATAYYYRYWPSVRIDEESYGVLLDQTRDAGGAGGYFERAQRIARDNPQGRLPARFLDVKSGYRILPDGTLEFEGQPFPTDWDNYRERHSVVAVPHYTMAFLDRPEPELADFRAMLEAITREELIAEFHPTNRRHRRDGVSLSIYRIRRSNE